MLRIGIISLVLVLGLIPEIVGAALGADKTPFAALQATSQALARLRP